MEKNNLFWLKVFLATFFCCFFGYLYFLYEKGRNKNFDYAISYLHTKNVQKKVASISKISKVDSLVLNTDAIAAIPHRNKNRNKHAHESKQFSKKNITASELLDSAQLVTENGGADYNSLKLLNSNEQIGIITTQSPSNYVINEPIKLNYAVNILENSNVVENFNNAEHSELLDGSNMNFLDATNSTITNESDLAQTDVVAVLPIADKVSGAARVTGTGNQLSEDGFATGAGIDSDPKYNDNAEVVGSLPMTDGNEFMLLLLVVFLFMKICINNLKKINTQL